jgi:hypothetical protein
MTPKILLTPHNSRSIGARPDGARLVEIPTWEAGLLRQGDYVFVADEGRLDGRYPCYRLAGFENGRQLNGATLVLYQLH